MLLPLTAYTMRSARTDASRASKIIDACKGWGTAIPRLKGNIRAGNTAVIEVVWKGLHKGPSQTPSGTIPPSNKSIEIPACQAVQVEGSKVKSVTHYFDMLTLLTQIGAAKG